MSSSIRRDVFTSYFVHPRLILEIPRYRYSPLLVFLLLCSTAASTSSSSYSHVDPGAWTSFSGRRTSSHLASLSIIKNPIGSSLHVDPSSLVPNAWLELPPGAAYHISVGYYTTNRSDKTAAIAFHFNAHNGREVRLRSEPKLYYRLGAVYSVYSEAWLGGSAEGEEEVRVALELPDMEDALVGMIIAYSNQSLTQLVEQQRLRDGVKEEL